MSDDALLVELEAALGAPLEGGAAVGHDRREAAVLAVLARVSPDGCRALLARLRQRAPGDAIALAIARMTDERRARIEGFLQDARKRQAQAREFELRAARPR